MRQQFTQIDESVLKPRLAEVGKIKLGTLGEERQKRGGKGTYRLPKKLDHFEVTHRARGKDGLWVPNKAVHDHPDVGDAPTRLNVRLLSDDPAEVFQYFFAAYDGKRLRCQGNGCTAVDREQGEIPCTCPLLKIHDGEYSGPPRPGNVTCKPYGRLNVHLEADTQFGGLHVFRTTSWESISNIAAALQEFRKRFGRLAFLPLQLVCYPSTDSYQDGNETKTSTSWKATLVLRADYEAAHQIGAGARAKADRFLTDGSPPAADAGEDAEAAEAEAPAVAAPQVAARIVELDAAEEEEIAAEFYESGATGSTDAPTLDAEIEEEEPGADLAEEVCRRTLQLEGWQPKRINAQVAKYSDDIFSLVGVLEKEFSASYTKAREELTAEQEAGADAEDAAAEDDAEQPALL